MRFSGLRSILCAAVAGLLFASLSLPAQDAPKQENPSPASPAPTQKQLTEKERKEREKRFKNEVSKTYQKWLNEDVIWIITPEEEAAFKQLSTDEERDNFIEQFWLRRDPTPDTVENEYRDEHYRRIAYANERFAAGVPGWKTDRGHIYIAWGPADEVESHASGGTYEREASEGGGTTQTYPFERWRYRYLEGIGTEVILEFVDSCMCGQYRLSMDPNEKDALLQTPNAGLTTLESMGQSTKADRISGGGFSSVPGGMVKNQFDALELMAHVMAPPPIKFKDLESKVTSKLRYNLMPFDMHMDFVRLAGGTVLVPITVAVRNKDVTFVNKDGVQRGTVNVFGRVTTFGGRVAQTFEDTVGIDVPESLFAKTLENQSVYWKALPLLPGRYKIGLAVKDVNGDRVGTLEKGFVVPGYDDNVLASSTVILADVMEKVPSRAISLGSFIIGDMKVRPRVESGNNPPVFHRDQRLNLWMQVYNLGTDEKTRHPSAAISYEVVNMQTNQSVIKSEEKSDAYGNVGEQITIAKTIPLLTLEPGLYTVKVTVNDNISKQTLNKSARFMVQ